MKVFVIHARRTGYGVIRALQDSGCEIYVADSVKRPIFASKYVKKTFVVSDIVKVSNEAFLDELIQIGKENNFEELSPVVFTGKDDYLQFFSKYYNKLSKYYQLSFEPNYEILQSALSKKRLIDIANRASVLIPKSFTDDDDLAAVFNSIEYPAIIKPELKNTPEIDIVEEAFRLRYCNNEKELSDAVQLLQKLNSPYVIQEYIPGDDNELYTCGVYSFKGELKAWSTSKKIRQFPPNTGQCSYGKTLYEDALLEPSMSLLKTTGLTGISQIEYKKYKGKYYLIEINPRIWAWHEIHRTVGVNFSKICMDQLHGKGVNEIVHPTKEEKYWMFFMMDLLHNHLLNDNISLIDLVECYVNTDMEAFYTADDPVPSKEHSTMTLKYIRNIMKEVGKNIDHKVEDLF